MNILSGTITSSTWYCTIYLGPVAIKKRRLSAFLANRVSCLYFIIPSQIITCESRVTFTCLRNYVNFTRVNIMEALGSLSNGVFERRTSTGSEVFFILKHLDAPKFVFLSVLTIIETSCPKKWAKPLSKNEKKPLPVDLRRSKTSLLKFTNVWKVPLNIYVHPRPFTLWFHYIYARKIYVRTHVNYTTVEIHLETLV